MPCFVYVLSNNAPEVSKTYVGWTTDLEKRLAQHNSGKGAKSTRGQCWSLVYAEKYKTRSEAMSREWHLKRDKAFRRDLRG
ncbi:MAG TPA: GIY-YIG nuclease family protein [Rhizomicrobium sp.]|nr:GIY-YIG nuclease family protein [Rhizomicrobium sp.]